MPLMNKEYRHIAVIGAGAMGGWTAYWLQQSGVRVTLLDPWGPGHNRSSSGGETRITRGVYGPDRVYVKMVAESFPMWREFERRWGVECYVNSGALWLFSVEDDGYLKASLPFLKEFDLPIREVPLEELKRRYPQIGTEGLHSAWMEEEAGFLHARAACRYVAKAVVGSGGEFRQVGVRPGLISGGRMGALELSDGTRLKADAYVFACGPWLPRLFHDLLGRHLQVTRQEVYFFGAPRGNQYQHPYLPVWLEFGRTFYYGIPDQSFRGFKIADDIRSHMHFDPETDDREPTPERIDQARAFLRRRFPGLGEAPMVESRVCQYTNSPDGHLLLDRHPEAANVWLAGAGTGHGYKLGPPIGKYVTDLILNGKETDAFFSIARLEGETREGYNQFAVR